MIPGMITTVQPMHAGNALRLFLQPPAGSVAWKILRKGSGTFTGITDPSALVAYEGAETVVVDAVGMQNGVMQFYQPWYTADGVTYTAGPVASGTPAPTYDDLTTDVLSFLRERLEAGLKIEVERGNLVNELGYVQVYSAPPSLERDLAFPLVTVHLEEEEPQEWAIGENIAGDDVSEGWLSNVTVTVIGWSLNPDERIELRKALRRVVVANLPVFAGVGFDQVSVSFQDVDSISGEYPAHLYQVMGTFTCLAPVRVAGINDGLASVTSIVSQGVI